ncbi:adenylyltransferase/cytidyltransferase family protein [Candidatus Woesearchaeota archaeon]|nr:adenylyltransferase/cytidyltransferase family protein [Candidatus Woesearchaeota archaeon]
MTTVCVSGYFTVLHKGHVKLFEAAKSLGDKLIVIVNNNQQQIGKKGKLIHDAEDIKYIVERLNMVDEAVISIDKDRTQCETLRMIKPDIFANGGDRDRANVPETPVCHELDIKMVDNVGGEKLNSSSDILKKGED